MDDTPVKCTHNLVKLSLGSESLHTDTVLQYTVYMYLGLSQFRCEIIGN